MKLVRFNHQDKIYYGYLNNSYIEVLNSEPWHDGKITGEKVELEKVRLLAPCQPNKILCTAINYPGATGSEPSLYDTFLSHKNPLQENMIEFHQIETHGTISGVLVLSKATR